VKSGIIFYTRHFKLTKNNSGRIARETSAINPTLIFKSSLTGLQKKYTPTRAQTMPAPISIVLSTGQFKSVSIVISTKIVNFLSKIVFNEFN